MPFKAIKMERSDSFFFGVGGGKWLPVLSLALVFEETIDESVESLHERHVIVL